MQKKPSAQRFILCTPTRQANPELDSGQSSRAAFHSTTQQSCRAQPCTTPYFGLRAGVLPLASGTRSSPVRIPQLRSLQPGTQWRWALAVLGSKSGIPGVRLACARPELSKTTPLAFPRSLPPGFTASTRCPHSTASKSWPSSCSQGPS